MKSPSNRRLGNKPKKSINKSKAKLWVFLPSIILVSMLVPIYFNISLINIVGVTEEPFLPTPPRSLTADVNIFVTADISCVLQFQGVADALEELQKCPQARGSVSGIYIFWDTPLPIPSNTSQFSPFYPILSSDNRPPVQISAQRKIFPGKIGISISDSTILKCAQWTEVVELAKSSIQKGSVVEVSKVLGSEVNFPGKARSILQTSCAPIGNLRPSSSVPVPGTSLARNYSEPDFSSDILHGQFHKDGYIGPMQISMTAQELREAADALLEHRQKVRKAARNAVSGMSEAQKDNYWRIFGKMHVAKERCYAYDDRCKKLVEHPSILTHVRSVIGDDITAFSIDLFDKQPGEIIPWHTDTEPYDRCFGKNVQLWIAVDGVSTKSTLEIATGSHHMPSLTWLFPEHAANHKTVEEKRNFEKETIIPCLESMDPTSRVITPVIEDGQFMILHSHIWHGSENTDSKTRLAIRIYYSHPECQPAAKYNYMRPNIPPFDPLPAIPPSLLVSGSADTWPNSNRVVQNFLHYADIPPSAQSAKEAERWGRVVSKQASLVEAKSWTPEEIGKLWRTMTINSANSKVPVTRTKASIFKGPTPLFQRMDFVLLKLSPHEATHSLESHHAPDLALMVDGSVKIFTVPKTSLLPSNGHKLGQVPEMLELSEGSILFIDGHGLHTQIGGMDGGTFLSVKYESRSPWSAPPDTDSSKGLKVFSPPLVGTFLDEPNFMQVPRVVAKCNSCVHDKTSSNDRETLIYVQNVPENLRLLSALDGLHLASGSVLYYPLGSTHGMEALRIDSGEKLTEDSLDMPSCIWIEFYA